MKDYNLIGGYQKFKNELEQDVMVKWSLQKKYNEEQLDDILHRYYHLFKEIDPLATDDEIPKSLDFMHKEALYELPKLLSFYNIKEYMDLLIPIDVSNGISRVQFV